MKKILFLLLSFYFAQGMIAQKQRTWCNPVNINYRYSLDGKGYREAADPSVVYYGGKYWLFASKSGGYWWSTDLLKWNFVESKKLPTEDYAPTAMVYKGALYFLASFENKQPLALFKTTEPMLDKWERVTDEPFKYDTYTNGTKCIDPMLMADGDNVYLYWGCSNKTPTWVVQLDPKNKFRAITEPVITIDSDTLNHGWERRRDGRRPWIEGCWTNKVNGKYYLQYAAAGTELDWYSDGYYVSDDPMKGFRFDIHNPFSMKPTGFVRGAGHSSTFTDTKENYWHMVTNCLSVKNSYERRLSLFPTWFDKDGVPYCCTLWGDYPQRIPQGKFTDPETLFTGWMLLSYKKKATASSTLQGYPIENAFDEDMKTYWSSQGNKGEWLQTDLGGLKKVYAVQINFADQDAAWKGVIKGKGHQYRVMVSTDGKNWKKLVDKSTSVIDAPHDYIELAQPVKARYVRLENIQVPYGKFAVCGLRVFGLGDGKVPAPVQGFQVERDARDRRNANLKWAPQADAMGYVIKYGAESGKLYHNFIVYGEHALHTFLLNAQYPYSFSIAAFNDNGVSPYSKIIQTSDTSNATAEKGSISFSQLMDGQVDKIVYKTVANTPLHLYKVDPQGIRKSDKRPAVVIIHGGGWTGGEVEAFFPHARYFASRGAVAFSVEYRLVKANESTVEDCVSDCKSAIRYIRSHATEWGIDPDKIIVMGDSAGGHLAGCMGTVEGFDDPGDDLRISAAPNMAILCNPLTDFTASSFIKVVIGGQALKSKENIDITTLSPEVVSLAKRLSPLYNVRKNKMHTLIMHGTADKVILPAQSEELYKAMQEKGNSSELVLLPGANHAFVCVRWRASEAAVVDVIRQIDAYMCHYNFLKGKSNLVPSEPEAWQPKK